MRSKPWHAIVVAAHRLAIDDAGARAQLGHHFHDQREAIGQVIAGAAVEPHLGAVLTSDDAEAVMFEFHAATARLRAALGLWSEGRAGRSQGAFPSSCAIVAWILPPGRQREG